MKLLIVVISICNVAFAVTDGEELVRIGGKLAEIKNLPAEDYFSKVDGYRSEMQKYFKRKTLVCKGEFSTTVLNAEGSEHSLSKEEQRICIKQMTALQTRFINNMFTARKRYLQYIHKKRIRELEDLHRQSLKELQLTFSQGKGGRKKGKRKRRLRRSRL